MANIPGRAALAGIQSGAPARAGPRLLLNVLLRLERRLALPGTVEVYEGQRVAPDTVLATAPNTPSRLAVVELTQAFERQLTPEEVRQAVLVRPGQPVQAGEVLARVARQGWFEREQQTEAVSPVNGIVEFLSAGRGQIVIRTNTEVTQERLALPVASHLAIEAAELQIAAVCKAGQQVEAGDLLARLPGFRPLAGEYRSPVSGTVESISPITGTITIVRERKPLVLRAALDGWVDRVYPGYGAAVTAHGHKVLGVLGLGGKSWGALVPLQDLLPGGTAGGRQPLRLAGDAVLPEHSGRVLAAPGAVDRSALEACLRLGVRGLIAASTSARELGEFIGRPLASEIVTGPGTLAITEEDREAARSGDSDDVGLTVILTEGFGRLSMEAETWQVLCSHAGAMVSVDGLTQIRAGVVRPALFLPVPRRGPDEFEAGKTMPAGQTTGGQTTGGHAESSPAAPTLTAGQRVRIVRHPYFGLWGSVLEPPGGLERLETEVEARVLTVELDDGRRVRVAEANIEF